jgi:hypothetical protein
MNYLRGLAFNEQRERALIEQVGDKAWRQKFENSKEYLHMFIKRKTDSHDL